MAREAARIGAMHVKAGDPERAVRYESFIESIEPSSPATNLLRNTTRGWFRDQLRAKLDAETVAGKVTDKHTIVYKVKVTPKKAGDHRVTGEIKFSVCNADSCTMKKVPLQAKATGV